MLSVVELPDTHTHTHSPHTHSELQTSHLTPDVNDIEAMSVHRTPSAVSTALVFIKLSVNMDRPPKYSAAAHTVGSSLTTKQRQHRSQHRLVHELWGSPTISLSQVDRVANRRASVILPPIYEAPMRQPPKEIVGCCIPFLRFIS
jgi:hypothetical protein